MEPVRDVNVDANARISELIHWYSEIHGFMAGHLVEAINLLKRAIKESDIRILTFTANLVSTGLRGIFAQLIRNRLFNIIFTTTGTLDHDIARAMGGKYLKGYFEANDRVLAEEGYHRLGNIFIPVEDYGPKVEGFVRKLVSIARKTKDRWGIYELLDLAGSLIEDNNSILRAAHESGAKVFVPGWPDGAFGTAIFMETQAGRGIQLDYNIDMKKLADIFFSTKGKAMALIIGGGISKHHAIWWSQFRNGLDYTVYITTAVEYDGSLSGARPREAISWGKIKPEASKAVVYGDATIILPIVVAGILGTQS